MGSECGGVSDARVGRVTRARARWAFAAECGVLDSFIHACIIHSFARGNVVEDDGGGGLFVVVFGLFLDGFIGGLDDDFRFRIRFRFRF